jgi:PAS domain S-box-containing protein
MRLPWLDRWWPAIDQPAADAAVFPSTAHPGQVERLLVLVVLVISATIFIAAVPFARRPLAEIWAFIPIYESALAINDLITAVLLYAQFWILRSRPLLVLACGYLFTAAMVVAHALTFPGLFSATGLLGAGSQSTAWLYMFWHAGFPIVVIAYTFARGDVGRETMPAGVLLRALLVGILAALAAVVGLTLLATAGEALLPTIMHGNGYTSAMMAVVSTAWGFSFLALLALWTRTEHTMIDAWLMVVMCAWIFDIGLSAVFNAGRFDLGFYAGRLYGLCAATFVLLALLVDASKLYGRLAQLFDSEQQQRRRESALRQRLFDTSLDLILVCDRQGKLTQVSPSCRSILGYQIEEMIGRSATDFVYAEDLDRVRREIQATRLGGQTRNFECRCVHKDGRIVTLSWTDVWSDIDQSHFLSGHDLSEHMRLEAQLRQAQKMEAVGQLAGGVAHDFNNLLLVITGNLELLEERLDHDEQRVLLTEAQEAAMLGAKLTDQLLTFGRRRSLDPQIIQLNDLVIGITEILRRTLGEQIILATSLAHEVWPTRADPGQFQSAIINMAVNARDAMPQGGKLVIETCNIVVDANQDDFASELKSGEYAQLSISDSGTGMPPEVREHVFEPFFTTKEIGRGTGLGLAMVYGFVKQCGGNITVHSKLGHGTTFNLYFPRVDVDTTQQASHLSSQAVGPRRS